MDYITFEISILGLAATEVEKRCQKTAKLQKKGPSIKLVAKLEESPVFQQIDQHYHQRDDQLVSCSIPAM